ncbi:MAG: Holliday junction DNA helicase RuvA [Armatimonadetes bacterium]|nr:Holliday junction DNA helicase RuvA [Armatimonadota bacterium]
MICQIAGRIVPPITGNTVVLHAGSMHYEILVSAFVSRQLQSQVPDGETTFYTIHYIEGAVGMGNLIPRLVGFLDPLDREFFEIFTTVKGLGIRKALKAFVLSAAEIAGAIESKDVRTLKGLPEIGPRSAEKMVAELRGKVARFAAAQAPRAFPTRETEVSLDFGDDACAVLQQLGYRKSEAEVLIRKAGETTPPPATLEALLQEIFRRNRK